MNQLFERFPTILALTSFAVLITTVVHEWGYFLVVGTHFQTLVSATDYLSNSILWLPQTLALSGGAWASAYAMAKIAPPDEYRTTATFSKYFVFGAALFFSVVEPLIGIPIFLVAVVIELTHAYLRRWPKAFSNTMRQVVLTIALILAGTFVSGALQGKDDLRGTDDLFRMERKEAPVSKDAQLLRSFDRGILVRNVIEGRVEFIRWDELRAMSVARQAPKEPKETWPVCLMFRTCPNT
jgi:hypothetical protein